MGEAAAGEVVVSRTVKDLVVGSGIEVDDASEHFLKCIEQMWQLCWAMSDDLPFVLILAHQAKIPY
jgi:hypothetical protein